MNQSIEGIVPYQVFQRDENNTARIPFRGRLSEPVEGQIEAQITKGSTIVLDWQNVGKASGESFVGEITGVPTGGEYTLTLRFPNGQKKVIRHLLVGDLWVMAGQSNMDGCGKLVNLEKPSSKVHAFYLDDQWNIAKDWLTWLNKAVDPVYPFTAPEDRQAAIEWEIYNKEIGAGLGVRFGKELYKRTGVPVGLIPCSQGGSSIQTWNPARKSEGGRSLYGATLRRINAVGGKVAGLLWYQGESDCYEVRYEGFYERTLDVLRSFREDLKRPDLPIIYAQLGRWFGEAEQFSRWNHVQWDQLKMEQELGNAALVATADLSLTDWIHLDAVSQRRLGVRMAHLARMLWFKEKDLASGPRPVEYSISSDRMSLTITYKGVNGSFKKYSRIMGFEVESDLNLVPIESVKLNGNRVTLQFVRPLGGRVRIWYGRCHNPAVNLIDSADLLAPLFGPDFLSEATQ